MYRYREIDHRELTEEEEEELSRQMDESLRFLMENYRKEEEPDLTDPRQRNRKFIRTFHLIDESARGEYVSVNPEYNPYYSNFGNIKVEGQTIEFDSSVFIDAVMAASNFEVYYENHNVRMDFGFYGLRMEEE